MRGVPDRFPNSLFIDQGTHEVRARFLMIIYELVTLMRCKLSPAMGLSSKVNLYKSLQSRLANEHSAIEKRGNDLRDASQTLVRDSGRIGGGFESNGIDTSGF
jgi:hypothetical protein